MLKTLVFYAVSGDEVGELDTVVRDYNLCFWGLRQENSFEFKARLNPQKLPTFGITSF